MRVKEFRHFFMMSCMGHTTETKAREQFLKEVFTTNEVYSVVVVSCENPRSNSYMHDSKFLLMIII